MDTRRTHTRTHTGSPLDCYSLFRSCCYIDKLFYCSAGIPDRFINQNPYNIASFSMIACCFYFLREFLPPLFAIAAAAIAAAAAAAIAAAAIAAAAPLTACCRGMGRGTDFSRSGTARAVKRELRDLSGEGGGVSTGRRNQGHYTCTPRQAHSNTPAHTHARTHTQVFEFFTLHPPHHRTIAAI